jgi:hypothetical protein
MSLYKNITVDIPSRVMELDKAFSSIAKDKELEVTYLLMKLYPSFLSPYERVLGTSHAKKMDVIDRSKITKNLRINDQFNNSKYTCGKWHEISALSFKDGVTGWCENSDIHSKETTLTVKDVLSIVRNALSHSNIHFGGENVQAIEHIYFGSNWPQMRDDIKILRCTVADLEKFTQQWITSIADLGASSKDVWALLEPGEA